MATRSPIECPICHELMDRNKRLERHLLRDHRKDQLAKFVTTEVTAIEEDVISE